MPDWPRVGEEGTSSWLPQDPTPLTRRELREREAASASPSTVTTRRALRDAPTAPAGRRPPRPAKAPHPGPSLRLVHPAQATSPAQTRPAQTSPVPPSPAQTPGLAETTASRPASDSAPLLDAIKSGCVWLGSKLGHLAVRFGQDPRVLTGVAGVAILAVCATVGLGPGGPGEPGSLGTSTLSAAEDAILAPLGNTIELVAQRDNQREASRSLAARVSSNTSVTRLETADATTDSIELHWTNPDLKDGDQVIVRRTEGTEPAAAITDGDAVELGSANATSATDSGLDPETNYTYTIFVQQKDAKPMLAAAIIASTRFNSIDVPNWLASGEQLGAGQRLVSGNGQYELAMRPDGTLVLADFDGTILWTVVATGDPAAVLAVDGANAVVRTPTSTLWSTEGGSIAIKSRSNVSLQLTDSAVVELLDGDEVIWRHDPFGDVDGEWNLESYGGALSWPVDGKPVTSAWGWRIHPVYGSSRFHEGVDINASCGTQIRATAAGTVTKADSSSSGYGLQTVIDNGDIGGKRIETRYAHQSQFLVSAGDWVTAGQVIGLVGRTGLATGCHLHLEVFVNGENVDPQGYL